MDRNRDTMMAPLEIRASLSARRAWIEIPTQNQAVRKRRVALRKESVDRNSAAAKVAWCVAASLSARRAWIEILAALQF